MELLPGSLDELRAAHPEVRIGTPCCVEGTWHVTIALPLGRYGYAHADDEAGLIVRLAAALGG